MSHLVLLPMPPLLYDSYGLDTSHTELPLAFINPFCRSLREAPDKNQVRKPSLAALQ